MEDPYYRLVLDHPVPWKLVRDLEIAPVCRKLRTGHAAVGWHRPAFHPRPRHEPGTVEHAHDLHLRRLKCEHS